MIGKKYKSKVFEDAAKVAHLTYQIGELDLLREKSQEIPPLEIKSKTVQSVIIKLKKTLKAYRKLINKGRGIAAIQIGIPLKIAIIFVEGKFLTIINPKIIKKSSKLLRYPEICMSANPIVAQIIRPSWVQVQYLDEEGNKKSWQDKDLILNRVFQHEIDHLEGIINIDLVDSKQLLLDSNPKYFKRAKFEIVKESNPIKGFSPN